MRRSELNVFWRNKLWVLPFAGLFFLIVSPIVVTCGLWFLHWDDAKDYYVQCFECFKRIEKDE